MSQLHDHLSIPTHDVSQKFAVTPDVHVVVRRFFALVIDSTLLGIIVFVVNSAFGVTQNQPIIAALAGVPSLSVFAVDLPWLYLTVFLYFFAQEALFNTTIGKRLMGLKVIDWYVGERLTIWAAFVRNLIRPIDAIAGYSLGGLLVFSSSRHRRLGDYLAGTLVVRISSVPSPPQRRLRFWLSVGSFAIFCSLFLTFCLSFAYYGRPSLFINEYNTSHTTIFKGHKEILNYRLTQADWGNNTVTYTVNYDVIDQGDSHFYSDGSDNLFLCEGHITFQWSGFVQGWLEIGSDSQCHLTP